MRFDILLTGFDTLLIGFDTLLIGFDKQNSHIIIPQNIELMGATLILTIQATTTNSITIYI